MAGKTIYFDPYEIPESYQKEKADIMLISHNHHDHFDENSAKAIKKADTVVVCPESCKDVISSMGAKALSPGKSMKIGDLDIKAVPAYNPDKKFHPKANNWVGYIVSDGKINLYHAGDTDLIPEMKDFKGIDYALLPVGDTYTMDFKQAIDAANVMKPKFVIPMHSWDKDLNEFEKMMKEKAPDVGILVMKQGSGSYEP